MSTFNQNSVSRAVWPWVQAAEPTAEAEDSYFGRLTRPALWREVLINILVAGGVGALLYFWAEHRLVARIVWTIGSIVVVSALFIPPLFEKIKWLGVMLGLGVGHALTWILLVPFFYIVFVPARAILVLKGKDPMQRAIPTDLPTYWEKRPPVRGMNQYRKQH